MVSFTSLMYICINTIISSGVIILWGGIIFIFAHQIEPLNQKRTLAFLNQWCIQTVAFLNHFSVVCEDKLSDLDYKLQRTEDALAILEAKVSCFQSRFKHLYKCIFMTFSSILTIWYMTQSNSSCLNVNEPEAGNSFKISFHYSYSLYILKKLKLIFNLKNNNSKTALLEPNCANFCKNKGNFHQVGTALANALQTWIDMIYFKPKLIYVNWVTLTSLLLLLFFLWNL